MWNTHTVKYFSALKERRRKSCHMLQHAGTFKTSKVSVSQTQKDKCCIISRKEAPKTVRFIETEGGCHELREEEWTLTV